MSWKKGKYPKAITIILIFISNAIVYYLTYKTGGIKSIYSHLMYLPVIFSGIFLGLKAGMMNAMFSGLLLGSLMPLDLTLSNPDELWFWLVRLAFLVVVGILTGYLSDKIKENRKILRSYEIITRKNLSHK